MKTAAKKVVVCASHDHPAHKRKLSSPQSVERAGQIFRALGDGPRLRLMELLSHGETCVSELVESIGDKFSTVSQRLRLLRQEGLIQRRRAGTHLYYSLADDHVADLIANAIAHADELLNERG